jgi:hypothetical protein
VEWGVAERERQGRQYEEFDEAGFDWNPGVRDRLRIVVEDCGLAQQLPDQWTFADIVL